MAISEDELAFWLALYHAPGIGAIRFNRLLKLFGTPRHLFSAGKEEWQAQGIKNAKLIKYLQAPNWFRVEKDMSWLGKPNQHIIYQTHALYPQCLNAIADAPPILFIKGRPQLLNQAQLAIVGSRNPSYTGTKTAHDFALHLAQSGWVITSGLAYGIDLASHQGALAADGDTIAVMGTGADRVYPAEHRQIADKISEQGALVSEFCIGTPPHPSHFPRRNRIISGLSLGTLVVEAALKSGSLLTAQQALEQGREVFAIPGSIHNPLARGCHKLLKQGAKLVETVEDINEELEIHRPAAKVASTQAAPTHQNSNQDLDHEYQSLLNYMNIGEPMNLDALVDCSQLPTATVASMLTVLELRGFIQMLYGSYSRIS